ncbi:MAG TPA: hypothetical protein VFM34_06095 [Moraxellaceae bacterium]|nr:hypothetical protein [Moraxellaceae bacterium]
MTGRTIPVTRSDGSEVAGEATQVLIHDQLDLKSSEVVAGLRGTGGKTLTDLWNELASTLAVSDGTTHTALASIYAELGILATDAKLEAVRALLAGTLAISAASLPLPSGAATSANQTTANTSLANILTALGLLATAAQLPVSLGSKTANGSLSVTGSTDGVFYVGGVSADGAAPTNQAVRVSGIDGSGLKRTLATDSSGYQYAKQLPLVSQTFSLTAATQNSAIAVLDGYNSWEVILDNASTSGLVLSFQYSRDGGTNWIGCIMQSQNASTTPVSGVSSTNSSYEGPIPSGATHVRLYVTSLSSGTVTGSIAMSPRTCTPPMLIGAFLQANNARVGSVFASGVWYDDTSSTLTANSTFTSTARDVAVTASGTAFNSASTFAKEYRVMAEQDVAFTLQIQASRDNSTFRVIQSITASAISGGGYVAEAVVNPKWRYYRYAIVNGASNAARTTGGSILMAI